MRKIYHLSFFQEREQNFREPSVCWQGWNPSPTLLEAPVSHPAAPFLTLTLGEYTWPCACDSFLHLFRKKYLFECQLCGRHGVRLCCDEPGVVLVEVSIFSLPHPLQLPRATAVFASGVVLGTMNLLEQMGKQRRGSTVVFPFQWARGGSTEEIRECTFFFPDAHHR